MYRNKKEITDNHSYQGMNHQFGTRKSALSELRNLIDRIDRSIKTKSQFIRQSDSNHKSRYNRINLLKKWRFKLRSTYHKVFLASKEEWQMIKKDIQTLYNEINQKVFHGVKEEKNNTTF